MAEKRSRRRPNTPPPLETEVIEDCELIDGSAKRQIRKKRGVLSQVNESLSGTLAIESLIERQNNKNIHKDSLMRNMAYWRQFLEKKSIKTDHDFNLKYSNSGSVFWSDEYIRYANDVAEFGTQSRIAIDLVRTMRFIVETMSDEQIGLCLQYGTAVRNMVLATYNREIVAGKKSIQGARQSAEAMAIKTSREHQIWATKAIEIALEIKARNANLSVRAIAIQVERRLRALQPPVLKKADTIARVLSGQSNFKERSRRAP